MAALDELLTRDVLSVAEELIGWKLVSTVGGVRTAVQISETEAYAGADDPASHAFRGRTRRNQVMFEGAGLLYVYRSYGIHWCMNVVVGEENLPHAVLLRGGVPLVGQQTMVERRGRRTNLSDGPGKLCQAMGVTGEHDGVDLRSGPIFLEPGLEIETARIERTPRIGITKAADRLWRFVAVG